MGCPYLMGLVEPRDIYADPIVIVILAVYGHHPAAHVPIPRPSPQPCQTGSIPVVGDWLTGDDRTSDVSVFGIEPPAQVIGFTHEPSAHLT